MEFPPVLVLGLLTIAAAVVVGPRVGVAAPLLAELRGEFGKLRGVGGGR